MLLELCSFKKTTDFRNILRGLQDGKMRKMAELQMSVVTDPKSRHAIQKQIAQWEENLEKLYIDQYRFRCYMASLQGSELPNPKVIFHIMFYLTIRKITSVLVCFSSNIFDKNQFSVPP